MTNRNKRSMKVSRDAIRDYPRQFGQSEFSKKRKRLTIELPVASGLAVSLDCRYKPNEVYDAFLSHYTAEFEDQGPTTAQNCLNR